jgi:hypothetical protein
MTGKKTSKSKRRTKSTKLSKVSKKTLKDLGASGEVFGGLATSQIIQSGSRGPGVSARPVSLVPTVGMAQTLGCASGYC